MDSTMDSARILELVTTNLEELGRRLTAALSTCGEALRERDVANQKLGALVDQLAGLRAGYGQLQRQRAYDIDRQADFIRLIQKDLAGTKSRLACWETKMACGHPEAALIMDDPPHCTVCDQAAEIARLSRELADLGEHLQTCPPNMCRDGHPEIRYAHTDDITDPELWGTSCPLCRAISALDLALRRLRYEGGAKPYPATGGGEEFGVQRESSCLSNSIKMCRNNHQEIRYEESGDGADCPMCRLIRNAAMLGVTVGRTGDGQSRERYTEGTHADH